MIIKEYRKYSDIDVYFPEYNWTAKHVIYQNFKNGNIKCPYESRIYGVGYLGEGKYKAFENGKGTDKYDIWHGLKCEFIRVGTQESVTGTIVNIFCAGGIRHFASNVEKTKEFSMRLYNKLTKTKYYDIDEELSIDIDNMKAEELEELVTTYLQVEKDLGVYTSTCKINTKTYECVMFDKHNFNKIYVQVKTGEINLEDNDYANIYNKNVFYFYSNSEKYLGNKRNNNIRIIPKYELIEFIEKMEK